MINCFITRIWDDDAQITLRSHFNPETGYVENKLKDVGKEPIREFITVDGVEHDLCNICHEYILKPSMVEVCGKQLNETMTCPNPDCTDPDEDIL